MEKITENRRQMSPTKSPKDTHRDGSQAIKGLEVESLVKGDLERIKLLVGWGANVTAFDNFAVRIAAEKGHEDVVRYLVEQGADISVNNNYPVRAATANGHENVVRFINNEVNRTQAIQEQKEIIDKLAKRVEPIKIENEPLQIGDKVTYTNDHGVIFPNYTITGFCEKTTWGAEVHIDGETPWYPVKVSNLSTEKIQYTESIIPLDELNANLQIVNIKDTPFKNSKIDSPEDDFCTLKYKDNYVVIKHNNGSTRMIQNSYSALEKFIKDGGFDDDENLLERQGKTILFAKPFTQEIKREPNINEVKPISQSPLTTIEITRHRPSVTQGEVEVLINGKTAARYGDSISMKGTHGEIIAGWGSEVSDDFFIEKTKEQAKSFAGKFIAEHRSDYREINGKLVECPEYLSPNSKDLSDKHLHEVFKDCVIPIKPELYPVCRDEINQMIAEYTKDQIKNHYNNNATHIEVAKHLLLTYTPTETQKLMIDHASNLPKLSNEARKVIEPIIKAAEKELKQVQTDLTKPKGKSR